MKDKLGKQIPRLQEFKEEFEGALKSKDSLKKEICDLRQAKKEALEELYRYQAQGAYIRSRAISKVEGEQPTKFFCELEKYNGIQKYVPQILVEGRNGQEQAITDQNEVDKEAFENFLDQR